MTDGEPTHAAISRFQQCLYKVRPQVQDEGSTRPMTHHGLRHSNAPRTYQELIGNGVSPFNATLRISRLLDHERTEVTNGYLVSVPKGGSIHA